MKGNRESKGRTPYYGEKMTNIFLRIPPKLLEDTKSKARQLSEKAGKKITASALIRTAIERLLKEI